MLTRDFWNVMIIDDEGDVHEVTSLMLKREEVFGARLKLFHANSASEALDMLRKEKGLLRNLTVALVDVVMETDHAGLDFCREVRETFDRHSTQLILRTGQPGQAPPRKIIDDYNISGYLTKLEASGDRLYMTLKAAIQRFYDMAMHESISLVMDTLRMETSPKRMMEAMQRVLDAPQGEGLAYNAAYDFWGEHYAGGGCFHDRKAYEAIKGELLARAEPELKTRTWAAPWGATTAAVPNRCAKVDNHVVVQAQVLGTNKLATLVLRQPACPRGLHSFYGAIWRQPVAYLAEVLARS